MIWSATRSWPGETCVILAGGPSLARSQVDAAEDSEFRILAINDSWRLAPEADCFYFCDATWHASQPSAFGGSGIVVKGCAKPWDHPSIKTLRFTGQIGLETDPAGLKHGSNSGYASINLAYHFGAKRILLLGYDMHVEGARTHWHDEPRPANCDTLLKYSFLPMFDYLVKPLADAGVEVINCTPGSALTCWSYMPIEQALQKDTING